MFIVKVDKRKKQDMLNFLNNHFSYWVANSWNISRGYAHNIKVHSVIPAELQDLAFELLDDEFIYYDIMLPALKQFHAEYPQYNISFNGRSNGYLVLNNDNYPYRDATLDTDDCSIEELRDTVYMVQCFDKACSKAINDVIDYLKKF